MPRTLHTMRTGVNVRSPESAHTAPQPGGIIYGMAARNAGAAPRGVRIPIDRESWWPEAAKAAADKRAREKGLRPPGIRDLTAEIHAMGVETDEDSVGRCLRGEIVTWEIARPLCHPWHPAAGPHANLARRGRGVRHPPRQAEKPSLEVRGRGRLAGMDESVHGVEAAASSVESSGDDWSALGRELATEAPEVYRQARAIVAELVARAREQTARAEGILGLPVRRGLT